MPRLESSCPTENGVAISEGDSRDREVHNGGVLLHKEVILGESLDAEDEVGWQFGQLEPLKEVFLVCFVLL